MTAIKNTLFLLLMLTYSIGANAQVSQNMTLLSTWTDNTIPTNSFGWRFSDCWGFANASGEYAIIGSTRYIHIFNVTNPASPQEVFRFDGGTNTAWREFRTYGNYLYAVTDQTNEGLRVFDLSGLPGTVTQTTQNTTVFQRCHTIHVDAAAGRMYCAGTNTRNNGLIVMDIATNPANPTMLSSVALPGGNYVHDCYVRDNKVYASHGNNGLYVWDFTTPTAPVVLGSMTTYVEKGYNHSAWMNDAGTHLVMTDETSNTAVKMVRVSNLSDIIVTDTFRSSLLYPLTNNTAHNPCVRGNFAHVSYYQDGIQVFDISNPEDVQRVGYYDTDNTNTNYSQYGGSWGVYPYLPSGTIIGSDVNLGLYVMHLNSDCRPPTLTTITAITNNSASINWNDIPGATGYRLRFRKSGTTAWTTINTAGSVRGLTNLEANTAYIIQVAANCSYGWTDYAKQYVFITKPDGTCGVPAQTWVDNITPNSARINWAPVSGVTSYRLTYRRSTVATWTNVTVNGTSRLLSNLLPNKTYEFKVAAKCNSTQYSAYTPLNAFTTPQLLQNDPQTELESTEDSFLGDIALSVYPNPVSDELHIELGSDSAQPGLSIQILDLMGKTVYSGEYEEENHVIYDLDQLPAGTYACVVRLGKAVKTVKFVKM